MLQITKEDKETMIALSKLTRDIGTAQSNNTELF
jgi:hypothetical protein